MTCTMQTQRRGPVLTLFISVTRPVEDYSEIVTDDIKVNDLAVVTEIFRPKMRSNSHLPFFVGSKKSEAASSLTVSMKICSGETVKHIFCQDECVEVPVLSIKYNMTCVNNNVRGYFYNIIVNITTHATTTSAAPATCKQLYEDTEFTDFKLQATDGVVAFHKGVLFVQSEMFRTMLRGQWKETAEDSINMEGLSVQVIQQLKDFMYLGTLPDEGLEPLLVVARRCLMDNLVAACIDKPVTTVKPETFDGLVDFAIQHNIPELVRKLVLEIPDNIVNGIKVEQQTTAISDEIIEYLA